MSTGIGCGITYILLNLSALPPSVIRFSGMLLYISIVALSAGLLFYLLAKTGGASLIEGALSGRGKRDG